MASKTVSRSVYQKVVEQNKRLLKDLKIICYSKGDEGFVRAVLCEHKWHEYFRKEEEKEQFLRDVAREYLKNHPELDIRNWSE